MEIKQLYHHCFESAEIAEGDLYPVGGGMIGSTATPWKVKVDFDNFYPKFSAITDKQLQHFQDASWQEWFQKTVPDIDPKLLTLLQVFTAAFEAKRKIQSTNMYERSDTYQKTEGHCPPLSDIFKANQAMCVEISLLAKKFLDSQGISSRIFSGEAMFDYTSGDINFPTAHTFLIIEHGGQEYIFDPANPTPGDNQMVFSLLKSCRSFKACDAELQKDSLMIAAENVLTHKTTYYGVGDCANVPEQNIMHGNVSEKFKDQGRSESNFLA